MSSACRQFRDRWLEEHAACGALSQPVEALVGGHLPGCAACDTWLRRVKLQVGMLSTLQRLVAPEELERTVESTFARESALAAELEEAGLTPGQVRAVAALRTLTRVTAPAELAKRVFAEAGIEVEERASVEAVRSLSRFTAPVVLERLVDEELREPRKARARRYVGRLERLSAPAQLSRRVTEAVREGIDSISRRTLLAAAALVIVVGLWALFGGTRRVFEEQGPRASLPPWVITPESTSDLPLMAKGMLDALTPLDSALPVTDAELDEVLATLGLDLERASLEPGTQEQLGGTPPGDAGGTTDRESSVPQDAGTPDVGMQLAPQGTYPQPRNLLDSVAHSGVRRVAFFETGSGTKRFLAYREQIVTDGRGGYSIRPIDALTPVQPDPQTFLFRMENQEGFIRRYRDYDVRDLPLFRRNYRLIALDGPVFVAGRECRRFVVQRKGQGAERYELAQDVATGLILRSFYYDAAGRPSVWMEYESVEEDVDFSGVTFHEPLTVEVELNLGEDFDAQLGFAPLVPKLLPPGYELREAATVTDPASGRGWVKLTFLDGVDALFFLQPYPAGSAKGGQSQTDPTGQEVGDRAILVRLGSAASIHARIGVHELVAAGRATEQELMDMIQSALP